MSLYDSAPTQKMVRKVGPSRFNTVPRARSSDYGGIPLVLGDSQSLELASFFEHSAERKTAESIQAHLQRRSQACNIRQTC
jgi:hypothetical protein